MWKSPQGYLYEKEAIYESLLHQKAEIAKKQQAYSGQKAKIEVCSSFSSTSSSPPLNTSLFDAPLQKDKTDKEQETKQAEVDRFVQNETSVSGTRVGGAGMK